MKKKILLIAILSSMSVSVYSASVSIRNNTDQPVWVQINNQKRRSLRAAEVEPLFRATAERGKYPDLYRIDPHEIRRLSTAVLKKSREEGKGGVGFTIDKIRFVRVKGYKTVTATFQKLRKEIKRLASKYANIGIFTRLRRGGVEVVYVNYFDQKRELINLKGKPTSTKITIELPEIEEFFYDPAWPIGGFKKHIVELTSWGNVARIK